MSDDTVESRVEAALVPYPDFPKPGITFFDIFPLFHDPELVTAMLNTFINVCREAEADVIVGLDARGFLLGPAIAAGLGVRFVPIRKQGKLPGPCHEVGATKEYGKDVQELPRNAVPEGAKVAIVDDLLATGGTLQAACHLVKEAGATPVVCCLIVELDDLAGRSKVPEGTRVVSLCHK